ncbi:MAG: PEP-CTERM sorting domain-containing protein [Akkermansia sp.]|nr:PEP-CTERM sorting domain-containing protein [Akkermansia sp.]
MSGDSKTLNALWVTDSDDALATVGDQGLFRVPVGVVDDNLVLTDYWSTAKYIDSLTFLDAKATDAWGMQFVGIDIPAVPEPATATLALLALAGLAARRRRR